MALFERIKKCYKFWYYQYLVHTGLYMLDLSERRVFTSLLVAFIAMASYTAFLYLPGHVAMLEHFLDVYLLGGSPEPSMATKGATAATLDIVSKTS